MLWLKSMGPMRSQSIHQTRWRHQNLQPNHILGTWLYCAIKSKHKDSCLTMWWRLRDGGTYCQNMVSWGSDYLGTHPAKDNKTVPLRFLAYNCVESGADILSRGCFIVYISELWNQDPYICLCANMTSRQTANDDVIIYTQNFWYAYHFINETFDTPMFSNV